jgi:hypothetical protein
MANGANSGTWGVITNTNLGTIIEDAISGLATVPIVTTSQALTVQQGAQDEARCAAIKITTVLTSALSVYVPPVTKLYVFQNATNQIATVYASTVAGNTTAAGSGIAIPANQTVLLRVEPSGGSVNVVEQFNQIAGNLSIGGNQTVGGNLAVTGNSTFTGTTTFTGSAALTGTPTAPTAAQGTNTTQIATTAFVQTAAGAIAELNTTNWKVLETVATQTATITIQNPAEVTVPASPANGTAVSFSTTGALPTGITANAAYYVFNRTSTTYKLTTTAGIQQSVAISIASPSVITTSTTAPSNNDIVVFATTGTLPSGLVAGTQYFVVNRTASTFQVSANQGGTAIATSGSQSGSQTVTSYTLVATTGSQSGVQTETTSKLFFRYKSQNRMSIDLGGNIIATGNVTGFGTP